MEAKGYRYSLCISYPARTGQLLAYRVADFDPINQIFKKAHYSEKEDIEHGMFCDPLIIGADPEELKVYEAEIREWIPLDYNSTRQWSYDFSDYVGSIYEVIKPQEFSEIGIVTDSKLQEVLSDGIFISEEVGERFLMVIDCIGDNYVVLKCKKNDFFQNDELYSISKNIENMLGTVHHFKRYEIEMQDIFSNTSMIEILNTTDIQNTRYFYKKTELPVEIDRFYVRNPACYTDVFLKKYFAQQKEKYQLTKKESKKLLNLMREVKNSEYEIKEFFMETGISYKALKYALDQYADNITNHFTSESEIDVIVERRLLQNKKIYNQCLEQVKDKWFKGNDEVRDEKEGEITKLEEEAIKFSAELASLEMKIEKRKEKINIMQAKIEEAEKKREILLDKQLQIEADTKEHIDRFRYDIIHATELIGVAEGVGNKASANLSLENSNHKLYIRPSKRIPVETATEVDEVDDIIELCEELSDNISLNFKEEMELAATVISALVNSKGIILPDSLGEIIADNVAALIDASTAEYVFVSPGQENLTELINEINSLETKTVYIDGLLNTFNESGFVAVCKNCKGKHLFFGLGTKDVVSTLSKNIWNYAIYLETESYINIPKNKKLRIGTSDLFEINFPQEEEELIKYYKGMRRFVKQGLMTNKMGVNYAYLLSSYHEMIASEKIGTPLLYSIYLCCEDPNLDIEEYEEKLKKCKIDESDIEKLKNC